MRKVSGVGACPVEIDSEVCDRRSTGEAQATYAALVGSKKKADHSGVLDISRFLLLCASKIFVMERQIPVAISIMLARQVILATSSAVSLVHTRYVVVDSSRSSLDWQLRQKSLSLPCS